MQKFVEKTRRKKGEFAFAIEFQKSTMFENFVRFCDRQRMFADQLKTGEKFQKLFVVEKMIFRLEFVQNRSFFLRVERFLRPNEKIFLFQKRFSPSFVLFSTRVVDHSSVKIAFGDHFFDGRRNFFANKIVEDATRSRDAFVPIDDQLAEIERDIRRETDGTTLLVDLIGEFANGRLKESFVNLIEKKIERSRG